MNKKRLVSLVLSLVMILALAVPVTVQAATPTISYRTQIQKLGWQAWKKNGATAGTSGQSLRLEAIKIKTSSSAVKVYYRTHVQKLGWQSWKTNNQISGTVGQSLRIEAIQIKLDSASAAKYDVYYRVHAQNVGWMGWAKNGASAGTSGYSRRLEAIQIRLVAKGTSAPGSTVNTYKKLSQSEVRSALLAKATSLVKAAGTSSVSSRVVYADINGNGWEEAILYNKNDFTVSLIGYNRVTGKAVKIATVEQSGKYSYLYALYSTKNHYFGGISYDTGGGLYTVYKISGLTAKKVASVQHKNYKYERWEGAGASGYYYNGTKISDSTYKSRMNAFGLTLGMASTSSSTYSTKAFEP